MKIINFLPVSGRNLGHLIQTSTARLVGGAAPLWTGNAASLLLRLAQNIVLARAAGPNDFGIYIAAFVYSGIFCRVLDCGIPNAGAYLLRSYPARTSGFLLLSGFHCLAAIPVAAVAWYLLSISSLGGEEISGLWQSGYLLFVALTTAQLANSLLSPTLVPLGRLRAYAAVTICPPLTALLLGCALALTTKITATTLVTVALISETAGALVSIALLARNFQKPTLLEITREIGPIYSYGLRAHPGLVLKAFSQRIDRIILVNFLSPTLFAAYAIAVSMRDQISTPITIHSLIVRNKLVDLMQTEKNPRKARSYYYGEQKLWFLLVVPASLLLALAMPWLMPIMYGSAYAATGVTTAILMLSLGAIAITTNSWCVSLADNKPGSFTMLTLASTIAAFAAVALGAMFFGINGAAAATVLVNVLTACAWLVMAEYHLRLAVKREPREGAIA